MEAIKLICQTDPEFATQVKIEFVGNVNSAFKSYVQSDSHLLLITEFINPLPHDKLVNLYGSTDLQLLVLAHTAIAPGNLPGKFFEYLASGKPILGIGPVQGDAAQILQQISAGVIRDRIDLEGIKSALVKYYLEWKHGKNSTSDSIQAYSRKYLTTKLISILESFD
jgi:glycosyltransferase involved in cell wall biosynthesis